MKNLIIGVFAALLVSVGLVGVAQTGANAADRGYTPSAHTRTAVGGPARVAKGTRATFCVSVTTTGTGRPHGTVTLTVTKQNHKFGYTAAKRYVGHQRCFTTPRLAKTGAYTARAHFTGKGVYKGSNGATSFRVVKRHR